MGNADDLEQVATRRRFRIARRIILILSVVGALRVFAFSAAYPVFDYVDEGLHLDVVLTFARVGVPGPGEDSFDPDAARYIATYGMGGMAPPYDGPFGHLPESQRPAAIEAEANRIRQFRNAETFAPPLYYALAALWAKLGRAFGLADLALIYWIRFLSAPMYGGAMWLACRICTQFHPQRPALAIAVGLILAMLPQDILYTINSDCLSPLTMTLALYLLLRWMHAPRPSRASVALAACAGVAASLALLGKYSNVGVLAIVPVAILLARRPRSIAEVATLLICTAVPVAAWMVRCQIVFGDWTALNDKYVQVAWTVLPLSESLKHPIFGPLGMLEFLDRLCLTFWRGEIIWDNFEQRIRAVDIFYLAVSMIGVLGTAGWLLRPSAPGRAERRNAIIYVTAITAQVVFLGLISTRFDYGTFYFPSKGFPYFAGGRLLSGVMAPFAILLAGGFAELLDFTRRRYAVLVPAAIIAIVCLGSELWLCCFGGQSNVFASPHNFYHLLW